MSAAPPLAGSGTLATAAGSTTPRTLAAHFADRKVADDYGAKADGVTDDSAAILAAVAALPASGGTVLLPGVNYYVASPILITRPGVALVGSSVSGTTITGALSLAAVVQFGTATSGYVNYGHVEKLTVSRSAGTPPTGSVGILWGNYNYASEQDVLSINHYYARRLDCLSYGTNGLISINYTASRTYAANCTRAYIWINQTAGVFIGQSEYGRNGGELYNPVYGIEFSGTNNDIQFTECEFIARGPTPNSGSMFGFTNYTGVSGIYRLTSCYGENWNYIFTTDAATSLIQYLHILGGGYAASTDIWNANAATSLTSCNFDGVNSFHSNFTMPPAAYVRIANCIFDNNFTATAPASNGGLLMANNGVSGNFTVSGAWTRFSAINNDVRGTTTNSSTGNQTVQVIGGLAVGSGSTATVNTLAAGYQAVSGGDTTSAFGFAVTATGPHGHSVGGQASDRNRYASFAHAATQFSTVGDAQETMNVLRGVSTASGSVRLTADAGAADTRNCVNMPVNSAARLSIEIVGRDTGTLTNAATFTASGLLLLCGATVGTMTLTGGGTLTPTQSSGTGSTASVTLAADTTNGGISILATGSNSNAWKWVARVTTAECA